MSYATSGYRALLKRAVTFRLYVHWAVEVFCHRSDCREDAIMPRYSQNCLTQHSHLVKTAGATVGEIALSVLNHPEQTVA